MTSPLCLVNGSPSSPTGANVTGGSAVTIALADSAGVSSWSLSCIGTDELNTTAAINAGLVISTSQRTGSFTAPASACALIFKSVVNNGIDVNGQVRDDYTTTFGVYVLLNGLRLFATNEMTEGNNTFGWITKPNSMVRQFGGAAVPSGNGIAHVVGGAFVSPASSIVNADVDVVAAIDGSKINPNFGAQAVTTAGTVTGGVGNFTSLTGSVLRVAGATDLTAFNVDPTSATFTYTITGSASQVVQRLVSGVTTNATPLTLATYPLHTGSAHNIQATFTANAGTGSYQTSYAMGFNRAGSADAAAVGVPVQTDVRSTGTGFASCVGLVTSSAGNAIFQVTGLGGTTINWLLALQVMES